MTTERAYRRPVAADAAVAELLTHAGAQFDPDVVAAFRAERRSSAWRWRESRTTTRRP